MRSILFLCSLLTLSGPTAILAHTLGPKDVKTPARACGTENPTANLRAAHQWLLVAEREVESGLRSANLTGVIGKRQFAAPIPYIGPVVVDTYFHVVSTSANANLVTDQMIRNQYSYLQRAYVPSNIAFRLLGVDRTVNDVWASARDDVDMKTALRKGTYSTLNVYFQTDLQSTPSTPTAAGTTLLGVCTLPANIGSAPVSAYITDGCNVLAGSMTGGPVYGYNLGGTAVHEIGHWLGLLHPFQDETCDPSDPGDYVSDTPQESAATSGCPIGKDSCLNDPGMDPINNYMDYSTDACYTGFSAGQNVRMANLYRMYRAGK